MTPEQTTLAITLGLLTKQAYGPVDSPLPRDLTLVDTILGTDLDGHTSIYGLIATDQAGNGYVGIRGTQTPAEWFADFEAIMTACPFCQGAHVEHGFLDIYRTFVLGSGRPLMPFLAQLTNLAVAGHSLGGPLATYLAAEARALTLVGFASPKPGDRDFADFVQRQIREIILLANLPDVVPHVPLSLPKIPFLSSLPIPLEFDFEHVNTLTMLNSTGMVQPGLEPAHCIDTYLHCIDPSWPVEPRFAITPEPSP